MKIFVILNIIFLLRIQHSYAFDSNEDYFDPVLNYLLNDYTDFTEQRDNSKEEVNLDGGFTREGGIWKCGKCDVIDDSKLIHKETNDVDTNIEDDIHLQVQVGLVFDEMHCITIQSDEESEVKIMAGGCTRQFVTLNVAKTRHFVVKVYGVLL